MPGPPGMPGRRCGSATRPGPHGRAGRVARRCGASRCPWRPGSSGRQRTSVRPLRVVLLSGDSRQDLQIVGGARFVSGLGRQRQPLLQVSRRADQAPRACLANARSYSKVSKGEPVLGTAGRGQAVGEQLRRGVVVALAEPDLAEDVIHQGGRQQRPKPVEGSLHARLRGRIPAGNWRIAARIGSPGRQAHAGAAAVPRPARAKAVPATSPAATRAAPGAGSAAGRERSGKSATIRRLQGCRWLAVWLPQWGQVSAAHIWVTVLPGERVSACASAR
jgi:hypothetical protein